MTTWKHYERKVAEYLDLPRVGNKVDWLATIVIILLLLSGLMFFSDYEFFFLGSPACTTYAKCMPF